MGVSLMYGLTILIAIPIHMTECLLSMWTSQGGLSHSFSVQTCSSRHLGLSHTYVNAVKSVKSMHSFTFSKAFMVGWNGMFDTPGLSAATN